MTVENGDDRQGVGALQRASMQPRPDDRGEQDTAARPDPDILVLQCSPGLMTVENSSFAASSNASPQLLQCSHGLMTVENVLHTLHELSKVQSVASMQPRPDDRGEPPSSHRR